MNKIPHHFHFIFGLKEQDSPFHMLHYLCLYSCMEVNPNAKIYIHLLNEPYGPLWEKIKVHLIIVPIDMDRYVGFKKIPKFKKYWYAHAADFIRLDVLFDFGGIYADMDTLFIKPYPEHFFSYPAVMGQEIADNFEGSLCNAIIMAEKNSSFIDAWRKKMPSFYGKSWSVHSTYLPYLLSKENDEWVKVVPEQIFFDVTWEKESLRKFFNGTLKISPEACSIHLWEHLWGAHNRNGFSKFSLELLNLNYLNRDTSFAKLISPLLSNDIFEAFKDWEEYQAIDSLSKNGIIIISAQKNNPGLKKGATNRVDYIDHIIQKYYPEKDIVRYYRGDHSSGNSIDVSPFFYLRQFFRWLLIMPFGWTWADLKRLHSLKLNDMDIVFLRASSYFTLSFWKKNKRNIVVDVDEQDSKVFWQCAKIALKEKMYWTAVKNLIFCVIAYFFEFILSLSRVKLLFSTNDEIENFNHSFRKSFPSVLLQNRFIKVDSPIYNRSFDWKAKRINPTIIFVGDIDYLPNLEAHNFLLFKIKPILDYKKLPYNIEIVSTRIPSQLEFKSSVVKYLGYVEKLDEVYKNAFCTMVPIYSGGGSKYKVIEAFRYGLPVISSFKGVQGLNVKEEDQFLLANTAEEFVKKLEELISSEELYQSLINKAKNTYKKVYLTPESN